MDYSSSDRGTLSPLPEGHRRGLLVLTVISFLSFFSTALLWIFITCKLISNRIASFKHRRARRAESRRDSNQSQLEQLDISWWHRGKPVTTVNDILELSKQRQEAEEIQKKDIEELQPMALAKKLRARANPFPILVYNLLFVDMMEALAYGLSIDWIIDNGIYAPSATCWAQGWLGSTSNLAASLFLSAISINAFITVVMGHVMPRWGLYLCLAGIWMFVFFVNAAGVLNSEHGTLSTADGASYFMRANVWCWISSSYNDWRFWSHYFWIIISVVLTVFIYATIFYILWKQKRSCRYLPTKKHHTPSSARREAEALPQPSGYHPAFLVYPFVYLICITPLVIGRICIILDIDLGIPYFAFAGSLLAGNGFFNSILWLSTILFSAPEDVRATGLDQFCFLRTPAVDYGHTVIISGAASRGYAGTYRRDRAAPREWWWWKVGGLRPWGSSFASRHERLNPDLLRVSTRPPDANHIQMDVVTRVVIEDARRGGS